MTLLKQTFKILLYKSSKETNRLNPSAPLENTDLNEE